MAVKNIANKSINQYELEHLIGQDAYSITYLAFDSATRRHVLLRILAEYYSVGASLNSEYCERVRALSQVRHPNIAIIYDSGDTPDDQPFMVSEHFEGFPLADRLNRLAQQQSPAHVIYALTLVRQIASGLSLAERLGYFHYELTPRHILLRNVTHKAEDSAVLINLDIPPEFTFKAELQNESYVADYLSPEQLNNKAIDGRSHVFSLGIILFQLLAGGLPVKGKSNWQYPLRAKTSAGSTLSEIRQDLSPETYALVDKATRIRAGSRYGSVADLVSGVDEALAAEDLRIHTSDLAEPRRPRPIYLAPLLLLLLCISLALAVWWNDPGNSAIQLPLVAISESPSAQSAGAVKASPSASKTLAADSPLPTPISVVNSTLESLVPSRTEATTNHSARVQTTPIPTSSSTVTSEPVPSTTPTELPPTIMPPTATDIMPTPLPEYRISVSSASLRRGPGTRFDIDGFLLEDETVIIIGKNSGADLWYVVKTIDGRIGWIASSVGEPTGITSLDIVNEAATVPAPPPTFTPTATPTPVPTDPPESPSGGGGGSGGDDQQEKPKSTPTPPL